MTKPDFHDLDNIYTQRFIRASTDRLVKRIERYSKLIIKTKSCKSIVKELDPYKKKVAREAAKTARMKRKGVDPSVLKQQENVLAESKKIDPDCRERLESSLADLKGILAELEEANEKQYGVTDEVTGAKRMVAVVEKLFRKSES